jgi:hypothetical protein
MRERNPTDWLERYRTIWEESFERLDDLLGELTFTGRKEHSKTRHPKSSNTRKRRGTRR